MTPRLSPRQREVLAALADGLSRTEVADRLGMSVAAVDDVVCATARRYQVRAVPVPVGRLVAEAVVAGDLRLARLPGRAPTISERQHELLVGLARGMTCTQIAVSVGTGAREASGQISALKRLMRAHSHVHLVGLAFRYGLLAEPDSVLAPGEPVPAAESAPVDVQTPVVPALRQPQVRQPGAALTRRQAEALTLVADGASREQVARQLGRSVDTVKSHLVHAGQRLEVATGPNMAVRAVMAAMARGELVFPPVQQLAFWPSHRARQVLEFVVEGLVNDEIAARMGTSALTVKSQIARLLEKFEANNRVHLAVLAVRLGVVPMPAAPTSSEVAA